MTSSFASSSHRPDTLAVLLLCGRFGQFDEAGSEPLGPAGYRALESWLAQAGMSPGDLLEKDRLDKVEAAALPKGLAFSRINALLQRGGLMALALESWYNRGLWVISCRDASYPQGLSGLPLLYGTGDIGLLATGGLAIVGSRDAGADALEFTSRVAQTCAEQEIAIISGGARGIDTEAMLAALHAGGTAVGVLADSLGAASLSHRYRNAISEGQLVLISPYNPNASFTQGSAMGRNKYIYALADWALVTNAAVEKGGTWNGAIEAISAGHHVFVRAEGEVPDGNVRLLSEGALTFPEQPWNDLAAQLHTMTASTEQKKPVENMPAQLTLPFS